MLAYLANAILVAHDVGANRWAITLNRGRVRFNVGGYLAHEIGRQEAFFALERSALDAESLPQLQQLAGWDRWGFKSYPSSVTCTLSCAEFATMLPLLRQANAHFIRWANWERDPTYRYIFRWQGQRYPVKSIMTLAYQGIAVHTLPMQGTIEERRRHLFAA